MSVERRISVADPISRAIDRTIVILFKPFNLGKWFTLGFCAFLAYLAEGGGASGWQGWRGGGGGGGGGGPVGPNVLAWIRANLGLIVSITVLAILLIVLLTAVLTWLRSRGAFMFLDGVVQDRGAVREPWVRFQELGNSLFMFSFGLGLIGLFGVMLIVGLAGLVAWPDIRSGTIGALSWTAILGGGLLLFITIASLTLIGSIVRDFVVPIMYLRDETVFPAWAIFQREILQGLVGTIALYLMRILLAIAMSVLAMMATCFTCCLAALPYLGTVILLPLYVFSRRYPLCFLEQYGAGWQFFGVGTRCGHCGYSLAGAVEPGRCPECGTPFGAAAPSAGPGLTP